MLHTAQSSSQSANSSNASTSQTPQKHIFAPGAPDPSHSASSDPPRAAQFTKGVLTEKDLDPSPITLFSQWFSTAQESSVPVPETCTFATAHLPSGRVSARMVYLKELDSRGFVVYSNWGTSRKSEDIKSNPQASLVFWWKDLERQVRIEGPTRFLTKEESQRYYETRARGSRIGAHASLQSSVLKGRDELDERVKGFEEKFEGQEDIEVPEYWGGIRVVPEVMEFWQGRESRLHDRFRYTKHREGGNGEGWKVERLSP